VRPLPRSTVGRAAPISPGPRPRALQSPRPRFPPLLSPQHFTAPSPRRAQLCVGPLTSSTTCQVHAAEQFPSHEPPSSHSSGPFVMPSPHTPSSQTLVHSSVSSSLPSSQASTACTLPSPQKGGAQAGSPGWSMHVPSQTSASVALTRPGPHTKTSSSALQKVSPGSRPAHSGIINAQAPELGSQPSSQSQSACVQAPSKHRTRLVGLSGAQRLAPSGAQCASISPPPVPPQPPVPGSPPEFDCPPEASLPPAPVLP